MEIGNIFRHLLVHNEAFVKSTDATKFLAYATRQNPYITLVTCADSRVQGNILGTDIFNKVFLSEMQETRLQLTGDLSNIQSLF